MASSNVKFSFSSTHFGYVVVQSRISLGKTFHRSCVRGGISITAFIVKVRPWSLLYTKHTFYSTVNKQYYLRKQFIVNFLFLIGIQFMFGFFFLWLSDTRACLSCPLEKLFAYQMPIRHVAVHFSNEFSTHSCKMFTLM